MKYAINTITPNLEYTTYHLLIKLFKFVDDNFKYLPQ